LKNVEIPEIFTREEEKMLNHINHHEPVELGHQTLHEAQKSKKNKKKNR
jgi:hypothetical protein